MSAAAYKVRARRDPGPLALLTAMLRDMPSLSGALCKGRSVLFDRGGDDASSDAVELCGFCPALTACGEWAARQPVGSLTGVWAGTIHAAAPSEKRTAACN